MNLDYFLTHRAHQLQNLCGRTEGNCVELPDRHSRSGFSRRLLKLLKSVDRICRLQLEGETHSEMLAWVRKTFRREDVSGSQAMLNATDRELLIEFERSVVQLTFDDDDDRTPAIANYLIESIWADRDFFYGLKPLPQHAEEFAYETLFPTWLNLYTALRQDRAAGDEVAPQSMEAIFAFLDDCVQRRFSHEPDLLAAMTFIAHRFPGPTMQGLLQRLMDLADESTMDWIVLLLREVNDSAALMIGLRDLLIVDSNRFPNATVRSEFSVVRLPLPTAPLPALVAKMVDELDDCTMPNLKQKCLVNRLVYRVMLSAGRFEDVFTRLLNRFPKQVLSLLDLIPEAVIEVDQRAARSTQQLIAEVASLETSGDGAISVKRVRPFAHHVAVRLGAAGDMTKRFLSQEFLRLPQNRRAILAASVGDQQRIKLADQMLEMAAKTSSTPKFFHLMSIAAAFHPEVNNELTQGRIRVIELARREDSIGKRELEDLVVDLRTHLPASLRYFENPIGVATEKSDRLAKLYLAIHEEWELYQHRGRVSNFGVTRAQYSNLTRLADSDDR
ncbi:MAG: hypothetical protein CMJ80_16810 [Planctomycetaceae bacterium]|nr:hypothetical protein [Planctomycetaceae bacterium]